MKKMTLIAAAVLGIATAAMADDLLYNGEFKRLDAKGVAAGWSSTQAKDATVKYFASGAPDGGYAQFTLPTEGKFTLRQAMHRVLKPNTQYKVSFKIRCVGTTTGTVGMVFINEGWTKANGVHNLVPTAAWKEYEQIFTTPDYKRYVALVFYGNKVKGIVEIADVEVEALDND